MLSFQILGLVLLVTSVNLAKVGRRVVNGTETSIGNYPFMISLRTKSGAHLCGGSILAPNYALTAAHCTYGRTPNFFTMQYGVTNIDKRGPNVVLVKRIIQHKGYSCSHPFDNDISLLQVEYPFPIDNKKVASVRLPKLNFETPQTSEGAPGVLAGWGRSASNGHDMQHLQKVDLKIYSNDECVSRLRGDVTINQICGGVDQGGKGQCTGDSGGPLLYKEGNKLTQVGIVSWSYKPCGRPPFPGVFTKVSRYSNWILNQMNYINNTIFSKY